MTKNTNKPIGKGISFQEAMSKKATSKPKPKNKLAKALPKSAAALEKRKAQASRAKTSVKKAGTRVGKAAVKSADNFIAKRIDDPTGLKSRKRIVREVGNNRGVTGRRPSSRVIPKK